MNQKGIEETYQKASRPLAVLLPVSAFILSLVSAILVSLSFYFESEEILSTKESENLRLEGQIVEPLLRELYQQSFSDVIFLSRTSPIQSLIQALATSDEENKAFWKNQLEQIFEELLLVKDIYTQISYIQLEGNVTQIVNVAKNSNGIYHSLTSRLQAFDTDFYTQASNIKVSDVSFSKIQLNLLKQEKKK